MPHNFVLVQPGTRQAVAEAVQTMKPDHLDKDGRAYIPWDGKKLDKRVLDATRLIEPGQKQTLKLTAPKNEGEYEYVCTFPGHWMIMSGKLIVTKDVDAYLQKNPEAPAPTLPGAPAPVPAAAAPAGSAPKPPGSASATRQTSAFPLPAN